MSQAEHPGKLLQLSDTEFTVANPAEDVRGRKVLDKEGEEIGVVDELLIDDRETKVRFLEVSSGGFLGFGATQLLIPVDAIARISEDAVYLNQTRRHIADAPPYDPSIVHEDAVNQPYFGNVYGYYGHRPYWEPGYVYPPYPYYIYPPV